jgi:hypothetical protein
MHHCYHHHQTARARCAELRLTTGINLPLRIYICAVQNVEEHVVKQAVLQATRNCSEESSSEHEEEREDPRRRDGSPAT